MDYFPAFLNLNARRCLLVGGGDVALRKARLLADAGARLTIIAPTVCDDLRTLADRYGFVIDARPFNDADVIGSWLVVSATNDSNVAKAVFAAASDAGVFCNSVDERELCSYITPAIVDRGAVVVAVSSGGKAPVLVRNIREQIERLLPSGIATLAELAGRWRSRVQQSIDTLLGRRRFWESVFDGPAGSSAINGDVASAESLMTNLLHGEVATQRGEAWLVGAGPGDPELLTLRALQIMQKADVIVHDRLVSDDILALARRDADRISVGKTPGCSANSQEEINALLIDLVKSGKRVCRLKGGDPFVFGRGGEEAAALSNHGIAYQVVPGITSAAGCAAAAGIPLTHRGVSQSVALVTAHGKKSVDQLDWPSLARDRQTLAFYMAVSRFSDLSSNLVAHGKSAATPIAIIENGTTPQQRVIRGNLGQLAMLAEANRVQAPAMLIVGDVAALGGDLPVAGLPVTQCVTNSHRISEQGNQNDLQQYS